MNALLDAKHLRCPISLRWSLVIGALLRIVFIAVKPLQVDECWTFFVATDDASLWTNTTFETAYDSHPFLFYALYRSLAGLITSSEWLFRLPVALFSIAALIAYRSFLQMTNLHEQIVRWSLLLFAVLPANIFYAYDARAYSLAQLVGIGVMFFYLAYRKQPTMARFLGLAICVGLSCTFDVVGLSPVIAIGLDCCYSLLRGQERALQWNSLKAIVIGGSLAIPYAVLRWQQNLSTGQADQASKPFSPMTFADAMTQLSPFGVGELHIESLPGNMVTYVVIAAVTIVVWLAGAIYSVRTRQSDYRLFWALVLPPFLGQIYFLLSTGGAAMHRRYLLVIVAGLVPILVAGAMGISQLKMLWFGDGKLMHRILSLRALGFLFLLPLLVSIAMNVRLGGRADWRTLYQKIGPELRETDGVLNMYASPAPGFVASPLTTYAYLDGKRLKRENFLESFVALGRDETVSLSDPLDWGEREDHEIASNFVKSFAGRRIWTFRTPLIEGLHVDLEPLGQLQESWTANGLEAKLFVIPSTVSPSTDQPSIAEPAY